MNLARCFIRASSYFHLERYRTLIISIVITNKFSQSSVDHSKPSYVDVETLVQIVHEPPICSHDNGILFLGAFDHQLCSW